MNPTEAKELLAAVTKIKHQKIESFLVQMCRDLGVMVDQWEILSATGNINEALDEMLAGPVGDAEQTVADEEQLEAADYMDQVRDEYYGGVL